MPDPIDLDQEKYLRQLVQRCQSDDPSAWKQLFQKYLANIKMAIGAILRKRGRRDLNTVDVMGKIVADTLEKAKRGIHRINKPASVGSWLCTIAANATRDHLDHLNTRNNRLINNAEKRGLSLDEPKSQNITIPLTNYICSPDLGDTFSQAVQETLASLAQLKERDQWVFRLKILFYNPFTEREIALLSEFLKKPDDLIRTQITELMENLSEKAAAKEEKLGNAVRLQSEIERKQYRLSKLKEAEATPEEIQVLEDEIAGKAIQAQEARHEGLILIAASNAEVAAIMGTESVNEQDVSNIMFRARERLKKSAGYRTFIKSQEAIAKLDALQ
jgi:DNA-directed RNA polymerase specialized sigma24 family protein